MIGWLRSHAGALHGALGQLARSPLGTLALLATQATALALPFLGFVLLSGLAGVTEQYGGSPQIVLYLDPKAASTDVAAVEKALRARADVARVQLVTRDQALQDLARVEGLGDVLAGLANNPLPDALIVTPSGREPRGLATLRSQLAKVPGVAEVQLDTAWVERLDALVRAAHLVLAVLAALMAVGVAATSFAATRLQVVLRAEEMRVESLFGATAAQQRRPFLYWGVVQGALAGALAVAIAAAASVWLRGELGAVLSAIGFPPVPLPGWGDAAAVVSFASLLGWIGAWVSASRSLARLEPT